MEHPGYEYVASQQAIAQYFDPKRYNAEEKQRSSNAPPQADGKSREVFYRADGSSFPYQYSNQLQQSAIRNTFDPSKQRLPGPLSHAAPNARPGGQKYTHMTAMQQRQEYMLKLAQHQQILQQKECAERMMAEQAAAKMVASRMRAPESNHPPINVQSFGHAEQFDHNPRQSAFTYTSSHPHQVQKVERRPSIDSIIGKNFAQQHPNPNSAQQHPNPNPTMMRRSIDPRQYPNPQRMDQFPINARISPTHPKEMVANRLREQQTLREWETRANQVYAQEMAASKNLSHPNISVRTQGAPEHPPPDQFEAELEHLKNVVQRMEMMREQRDKYKSSAFQYLEKLGGQVTVHQQQAAAQPIQTSPASTKKNYPAQYYQSMPPPHQHVSSPPKFNEQLSPQRSPLGPPNRYIDPADHQKNQQIALYQKLRLEQQRLYQSNQAHHAAQNHAIQKKELSPIQIVSQGGLPKIVDVRSLADRQGSVDRTMSPFNRSKRRSSEPVIAEGRVMKMRMSSSPEGYPYEISDTRADSCDSGVESLASPEAQMNSHLYNRSTIAHVQQQHLEAVKAQHAASFDAMKRQQQQQQPPQQRQQQQQPAMQQFNRNTTSNVLLERAGSPRKLSELIRKPENECPSLVKGIDSLTCSCQECLLHQEKTEIEIRDLYRERKIKKYTGAPPVASSVTKTQNPCHISQNSAQQSEVILIEDNYNRGERGSASMKRPMMSTNEYPTEHKRTKVTHMPQLNIVEEALDLSKKQSAPKSQHVAEHTPLDLKVHPKDNTAGERGASNKDQPEQPQQSRSLTVEQMIASCVERSCVERASINKKTHLRQKSVTSLEQIITECIDQEQSFNRQDKEQVDTKEPQTLEPDLIKTDSKVLPSTMTKGSTNLETNNNIARDDMDILNASKIVKQLDEAKHLKQAKMQSHQENKDLQKEGVQTEPMAKKSEVEKVLESQVHVVLKVVVEKLKVNSDMYLPGRDEAAKDQPMLQRTSSVPGFKICTPEEVVTQRSQSVGLANTISPVPTPPVPVSHPPLLKNKLICSQQNVESCDRPLSAPPDGNTLESTELEEEVEEQAMEMGQGHKLASLYQSKSQGASVIPVNLRDCWDGDVKSESKNVKELESQPVAKDVIPQNLKDCWNDGTAGDNKKTKESTGNPKMQWKAQWAKEKKTLEKPLSLCEICGVSNTYSDDLIPDDDIACTHELQEQVASTQQVIASTQPDITSSPQDIASSQTDIASSQPDIASFKKEIASSKKDIASSQKRMNQTVKFGSLFQPKQFQRMFIESTKAQVVSNPVIANVSTSTTITTPSETSHNFPAQISSLAVINGKQHGKATIFHKPKAAELKVDQQNPKLAGSELSDIKLKPVELDKQFPRLAPSPTAALENSSSSLQEPLHTCGRSNTNKTISQPPSHASVKNVLRVPPNMVQIPSTVSQAVQISAANDTKGDLVKPHTTSVEPSGESPELVAMDLTSGAADGQASLSGQPNTQTLRSISSVHSTNVQAAQPCTNSSNVHSVQVNAPLDLQCEQNKDQTVDTGNTSINAQLLNLKFNDKFSTEQSAIPTSMVSPMMKSVTTASVAQTISAEPKSQISRTQPSVSVSTTQSAMQVTVGEYPVCSTSIEQPAEVTSGEHPGVSSKKPSSQTSCVQSLVPSPLELTAKSPLPGPPKLQPLTMLRTSGIGQSLVQTSGGQLVMSAPSTKQSVLRNPNLEPQVPSLKPCETHVVSTACTVLHTCTLSSGQYSSKTFAGETASVVMSKEQSSMLTGAEQPLSLVSRATCAQQSATTSGANNKQALPKLQVVMNPKVPIQVQTSIGPPPILISNAQSRPRTVLPAPMKLQVAQPVVQNSSVHVVSPTSTVQVQSSLPTSPVIYSLPKETMPTLQLITDTMGKTNLPSDITVEGTHDNNQILGLENINRRLKSNAPHIHVPTANGFIRYQKDSQTMREIYRVEMHDESQPLDLKVAPKKKQIVNASKVVYLQHNFPCVIRSEVPFVPPQMLQEAFFAVMDYGDFNYALQKCGINHRYMTMHEQGAMSRACVTRTWNGSCKLIPLDEFDAKFEQISSLLERNEEEQ